MLKDFVSRVFPWQSDKLSDSPTYRIALDIGTEYVKAVYIEQIGQVATIVGVGRARQDYADMESGAVANIAGVVRCCRQAMTQGAVMAGVKPTEVVIGVAGQFVTGITRTVVKQRKKPEKPLTRRELLYLVEGVHRQALKQAMIEMAERLGFKKMDMELVNSAIVNICIDGYPVSNPLGFCGRNAEITVFMAFAPFVHVSAMRTIAQRLDLELVGFVAEPYAVAVSSFTDESYEFGSLVMDIGGGSTDIALIHRGGIVKTQMVPMGGRAFTKGIAAYCRKTLREAEQLKLDYATGINTDETLKSIINADLEIWQDAILLGLKELISENALPPRIVLCGGGSGLPGIIDTLTDNKVVESGLFSIKPDVKLLNPEDVYGIADPKEFLGAIQDVTPKSIAFQAALIERGTSTILGGVQFG